MAMDPKDIGKQTSPGGIPSNSPASGHWTQRRFHDMANAQRSGDLGTKVWDGTDYPPDTRLAAHALRIAQNHPETRAMLLPVLREWAKRAHISPLKDLGLSIQKARKGEGMKLYMVREDSNNSKFYEGIILPEGDDFRLIRRWGALTDKGFGRIEGSRFDSDPRFLFGSMTAAQAAMNKIKQAKVRKGYVDVFSRAHKGPVGEYPIGLNRDNVGFGWGSQSGAKCIPALVHLRDELQAAKVILDQKQDPDKARVEMVLGEATDNIREVAREDSPMAQRLMKMMGIPIRRIQGISKRFLPDPDSRKLRTDLVKILNYVNGQLSACR